MQPTPFTYHRPTHQLTHSGKQTCTGSVFKLRPARQSPSQTPDVYTAIGGDIAKRRAPRCAPLFALRVQKIRHLHSVLSDYQKPSTRARTPACATWHWSHERCNCASAATPPRRIRSRSCGRPAPTEARAIGMLWNRILILPADQLDWPKLLRGVATPRATGSQSHDLLVSHRVSEYETAETAEDHTASLERATSTRRTPGRNWGLRHRLETPIESPSKAQRYPIQNSVG